MTPKEFVNTYVLRGENEETVTLTIDLIESLIRNYHTNQPEYSLKWLSDVLSGKAEKEKYQDEINAFYERIKDLKTK